MVQIGKRMPAEDPADNDSSTLVPSLTLSASFLASLPRRTRKLPSSFVQRNAGFPILTLSPAICLGVHLARQLQLHRTVRGLSSSQTPEAPQLGLQFCVLSTVVYDLPLLFLFVFFFVCFKSDQPSSENQPPRPFPPQPAAPLRPPGRSGCFCWCCFSRRHLDNLLSN